MKFSHATQDNPPDVLVIAEIGVNHDGNMDRAAKLIEAARAAGADAVKFQCFEPRTLLAETAPLADYQQAHAQDAAEMLGELSLPPEAFEKLSRVAQEAELAFIVTPFSLSDVDVLAKLRVDAIKIASPDVVNDPLVSKAMTLGFPMLISTGMAELDEVAWAAEQLHQHSATGALLHCVSSYPCPVDQASLAAIGVLRERYNLSVGYSDHTMSTQTGALAVTAGACVLEKHLTHDREAVGPDHSSSLEPDAFAQYVEQVRLAQSMLGPVRKTMLPIEADAKRVARQGLYLAQDVEAGETLTVAHLTTMRPIRGLPARAWEQVLGKRMAHSKKKGQPIDSVDLE